MVILCISFLLIGCATTPMATAPLNQKISWQARQAQLAQVQNFQAQGMIGIRYQQRAESANVTLTQTGENYDVELYGPLGADRVVLIGSPGQVTLKTSDGNITHAKTPEILLQQRLGWSLPINNLYYWLRGLPAPKIKNTLTFDAYHHLVKLQQQGWVIRYARYAAVDHTDLPTKIFMEQANVHATIVISQWKINYTQSV